MNSAFTRRVIARIRTTKKARPNFAVFWTGGTPVRQLLAVTARDQRDPRFSPARRRCHSKWQRPLFAAGAVTVIWLPYDLERGTTVMTVRRLEADGNADGPKSGLSVFRARRGLLTLRAAVILSTGLIAGVATGVLTGFATHNLAGAFLVGIPACAGAIKFLDALID